jgi:hypothetical protein
MKVYNNFIVKASILVVLSVIAHLMIYILSSTGTYSGHHQFHNIFYSNNLQSGGTEQLLFFVTFLSTLFAIFFVYTGFKIDSTREKVDEAEKRVLSAEKMFNEDILEYGHQLQYVMSFIVSNQHQKAIDALTVLRYEPMVLRDNRKINTCNFFLAHCYYEKHLLKSSKDDLALAVEYVDQAFEAEDHPFKLEIINAFNEMDKQL